MLKNKKLGQIIIVFVFVVTICMQFLWCFLFELYVDLQNIGNIEELQNIENRKMASKPIFSAHNYTEYFLDYEKYFNDNYTFRSPLISISSKLDYFLFQKSTNKNVILGEEGWFFLKDTLADYQKDNLYTKEELEVILKDVLTTKSYFEEKGIEFVLFIAPNKNTIYGEYMPQSIDVSEGISRTEQAVEYLREKADITIIYPKEEMQKIIKEDPDLQLFFKLDTHWNYMGGYVATKVLLEELGISTVPLKKLMYEEINEPLYHWNGYDLANMLGLNNYLKEDTNYHLNGYSDSKVVYEKELWKDQDAFWGYTRTYSDAKDQRKIFLARDSFGEGMVPYLAGSFKEMYSGHIDSMTKTDIETENPDVFIYEIVERNGLGGINVQKWKE